MAIVATDQVGMRLRMGDVFLLPSHGGADVFKIPPIDEQQTHLPCGACIFCGDVCGDPACVHCENKKQQRFNATESSSSTSSLSTSTSSCIPCCCDDNEEGNGSTQESRSKVRYYTMCQIRRHNTERSAWLVIGKDVYDATSVMRRHPGGKDCILKRSGGKEDCTQDFQYHSSKGRQIWRNCYVGRIRTCPSQSAKLRRRRQQNDKHWWMFWI